MTVITVSDPEFLMWLRECGINVLALDPDSAEKLYDVFLSELDEDDEHYYDDW